MPRSLSVALLLPVVAPVLATGLGGTPAAGQTPGREPATVEVPSSTRAMPLGDAYPLGSADADVLFYNPALLSDAEGSLSGGVHLFGDEGLGFTLAVARPALGASVGLGLQVLHYGSPGPGRRDGGLDPLARPGGEGVSEVAASFGVARSVAGFDVGVVGKVVDQRWPGFRQASGAVDVGVAREVGPLTAGLAVRNLGPDRAISPGGDVPQPRAVTLGVGGYGREVGPLDVGLAAAATLRDDEEVVVGGGVEVGYWPVVGRTFVVRFGGRTVPEGDARPFTAGASFWGDDLVLSWAWQPMDGLDSVHRFSIGWR